MEWVETTARTVEEAVDQALDQLGVDEQEAEWEVVEEPRQGLFGRVRGQARVRARIRPKAQPAKQDRRERRRRKPDGDRIRAERPSEVANASPALAVDAPAADGAAVVVHAEDPTVEPKAAQRKQRRSRTGDGSGGETMTKERNVSESMPEASIEEVAEQVEGFLTGLVAAFGEDATVEIDRSEGEVVGRIGAKLGLLIGPKGQTLEAIQELTRMTAQRTAPSEIRIKVDVGEYRAHRQAALERFARDVAARVRETGKAVALEPMPSPDRKIVHDALAGESGVATHSDGAEPRRRVVVAPSDGG